MKCKVCGAESGKYPLCRLCNDKKERGEVVKCDKCGQWHYTFSPCSATVFSTDSTTYLYEPRKNLITQVEQNFYDAIKLSVPNGYFVFPQVNLAAFIQRTDDARFHNELFRNVDFLVTDPQYKPIFIIEINDQTHLNSNRKERDEKVGKICEEAGIPIVKFWTSYGVNPEYIKKRIDETLTNLPVMRIHHFNQPSIPDSPLAPPSSLAPQKKGCYIATCVYGSYDCPQVWALRRYRDHTLSETWFGRLFVRLYYTISPTIVTWFGNCKWFRTICKFFLDKIVSKLQANGIDSTPYND